MARKPKSTPFPGRVGVSHVGPPEELVSHGYAVTDRYTLVSLAPWTGPSYDPTGSNDDAFTSHLLALPGILLRRGDLQTVIEGSVLICENNKVRWVTAEEVGGSGILVAVHQARLGWPEWDRACAEAGVICLPIQTWN
jgi:hypothetical protein